MKKIKFGFCLPIFANPGMAYFRTPAYEKLDWNSIKETVLLCDRLNYDSIFIADHVFLGRDGEIWECLSLMSALAAITSNVDVAPIHLCNNFRHPAIVANRCACRAVGHWHWCKHKQMHLWPGSLPLQGSPRTSYWVNSGVCYDLWYKRKQW